MPKVWLITGCSSGFGQEIALAALEHGDKVVATARDPSKLQDLVSKGAFPAKLDVTSSDETIASTVQNILQEVGQIDILVNNAGYGLQATVEEASPTEIQTIFSTNVFGMLTVIRAVLPHMRSRRSGVVANIGSIMGWTGTPGAGFYCATKAACTIFSESLRGEVAGLGIEVTAIEPGNFRTNILSDTAQVRAEKKIADFEPITQGLKGYLQSMDGKQEGDTKKGARLIVEALTGTGRCAGRKLPPRLALGRDSVKYIGDVLDTNRKHLDEWAELISTTDYDDPV
ncbi:MAG: hypothetical protein Q9195_002466 [Heterodermia aff. obscurata]